MRRLSCLILPFAALLAVPTASAAPWNIVTQAEFSDNTKQWSRDVELADLDGNGWVDILFANVGGVDQGDMDSVMPNEAYLNTDGVFEDKSLEVFGPDPNAPDPPTTVADTAQVIKTADVDGDGDLDIAIGRTWKVKSTILQNDGGGVFTDVGDSAVPDIDPSPSVGDLEFGDVDGDGDLDIALTNWGPVPVGLLQSKGGRTMLWDNDGGVFSDVTAERMPDLLLNYSLDLDFVDVDNDWDLDLVIACKACTAGSFLFINDGLGMFSNQTPGSFAALGARGYEAMDVDGDGDMDLVTLEDGDGGGEQGFRNRLLLGDGVGGFVEDVVLWTLIDNPGSGDRAISFFDFNSDADVDMALGINNIELWPDRIMVLDGTYQQNVSPFGGNPKTFGTQQNEVADLNGDHRMDIVLAAGENFNENTVFFGNANDMAPDAMAADISVPTIPNLETIVPVYDTTARVHARVHDYKTPHKDHDWDRVWLEWAGGELCADIDLETDGEQVDSTWYGEHLFYSDFVVPEVLTIKYRQCARDAALNEFCGPEICEDVDGLPETTGTTGDTDDPTTDPSTTSTTDATTGPSTTTDDSASASESETTQGPASTSSAGTDTAGGYGEIAEDGCGCQAGAPASAWSLLGLLALFRRRRPRVALFVAFALAAPVVACSTSTEGLADGPYTACEPDSQSCHERGLDTCIDNGDENNPEPLFCAMTCIEADPASCPEPVVPGLERTCSLLKNDPDDPGVHFCVLVPADGAACPAHTHQAESPGMGGLPDVFCWYDIPPDGDPQ